MKENNSIDNAIKFHATNLQTKIEKAFREIADEIKQNQKQNQKLDFDTVLQYLENNSDDLKPIERKEIFETMEVDFDFEEIKFLIEANKLEDAIIEHYNEPQFPENSILDKFVFDRFQELREKYDPIKLESLLSSLLEENKQTPTNQIKKPTPKPKPEPKPEPQKRIFKRWRISG